MNENRKCFLVLWNSGVGGKIVVSSTLIDSIKCYVALGTSKIKTKKMIFVMLLLMVNKIYFCIFSDTVNCMF